MSTTLLPDLNLLPAEALKALVRAQHEQLLWRENEIEHLKLLIAKLQRMQFGRKSEKLARQIEQLELRLPSLLVFLRNQCVGHSPNICPVKRKSTNRKNRLVRIAAAS